MVKYLFGLMIVLLAASFFLSVGPINPAKASGRSSEAVQVGVDPTDPIRPAVPGVNWPDIVFDYAGNMYGTSGSTSPGPAVLRSLVSVNTVTGATTFGAPTVYSNLAGLTSGWPWGLAFDHTTGDLYVSSTDGKVFKISSSGTATLFSNPGGYLQFMTIIGGYLYVADSVGDSIHEIDLSSGSFSTFVFMSGYQFRGLTTDGTNLFATSVNGYIQEILVPSGTATTIGYIPYYPEGIDIDGLGDLYVAAAGVVWQIPYTAYGYGSPFIYAASPIQASHGIRINRFLYVSDSVYQGTGAVFQVDLPTQAVPLQYYLSVITNPSFLPTIPGAGWYNNWTYVSLTAPQYLPNDTGVGGVRYVFSYWDVDGTSQGTGTNPISVLMDTYHTATAYYLPQWLVTFNQTGLDQTATGTVVTVDGSAETYGDLPFGEWVNNGTSVSYSYQVIVSSSNSGQQFRLSTVSGPSSPMVVSGPMTVTATYLVQYYLTVTSPYGSPSPVNGWFDSGAGINASVTSPVSGGAGVQYVCTGWSGSGSVPSSGSETSTSFTITQASSVTWNWKTQYYLTVRTDPAGIVTIPGEGWYDASTSVPLSAPLVPSYTFVFWDVDGLFEARGVTSISASMDAPHTATAHYVPTPVGGYSVPIGGSTMTKPLIPYLILMAMSIVGFATIKRKATKRQTK